MLKQKVVNTITIGLQILGIEFNYKSLNVYMLLSHIMLVMTTASKSQILK